MSCSLHWVCYVKLAILKYKCLTLDFQSSLLFWMVDGDSVVLIFNVGSAVTLFIMYSWLSRLSTTRGLGMRFSLVRPIKVWGLQVFYAHLRFLLLKKKVLLLCISFRPANGVRSTCSLLEIHNILLRVMKHWIPFVKVCYIFKRMIPNLLYFIYN